MTATMLPSWRCALAESLRSVLLANAALQEAVDLLYALLHRCRDRGRVRPRTSSNRICTFVCRPLRLEIRANLFAIKIFHLRH